LRKRGAENLRSRAFRQQFHLKATEHHVARIKAEIGWTSLCHERAQRLGTVAWTLDFCSHFTQQCRASWLKPMIRDQCEPGIMSRFFAAVDVPVTIRNRMRLGTSGNDFQYLRQTVLGFDLAEVRPMRAQFAE